MDIREVKMSLNRKVVYMDPMSRQETEYILVGCTIRKNSKTDEFYYLAELLDLRQRSVLNTSLSNIKRR